ncbi:hypothetical protein [Thermoanaerobacterium sp. PSU-2]|uniref:hypothetical protein n=1 Tax=Thermoanaerobacterium sp. PSU-2 TaxID=1930849 RepID=UPI00143951CD|nr:hypothetical protein [Thermoanaerobacterium sp. PSU-2]
MKAKVLKHNALIHEGRIAQKDDIIEVDKKLAVQYAEMGLVEILEVSEDKTKNKAIEK